MAVSTSSDRRARRPAAIAFSASFLCLAPLLAGCGGPQSALAPAGEGAARTAELFWVMTAGAAVLWVVVIGLAIYATRVRPRPHGERGAAALILWGGAIGPTVILAVLLTWGLRLMPPLRAPADGLQVAVTGEQYWWRVRYLPAEGAAAVVAANELRLPVGTSVELVLESADVIHSFWVPSLAGKMDMIPGRTTRLLLEPTRTGTYRGACAEFCGTSHALMALDVVVMEPRAFQAWLRRQARPAVVSAGAGRDLFLRHGCGACHTVRGTGAAGVVGPDLTHIGSRHSIGAGLLENNKANRMRFIADPAAVKPGVEMPAFGMLPHAEIEAIADWLGRLR